jgi:polyisoprenoid-binding protein YceI
MSTRKKIFIAIGILAVAGIAVGAWWFFKGNKDFEPDKAGVENCDLGELSGTYISHPDTDRSLVYFEIDGPRTAKGNFGKTRAELVLDGNLESAKLKVVIEAGSIDTDHETRDSHLKEEDFFNVAEYPEITFTSSAFEKVSDKVYKVTGTLSMLGTEKEFSFEFTHRGCGKLDDETPFISFEAEFPLNRLLYGMAAEDGVGDLAQVRIYMDMVLGGTDEAGDSDGGDDEEQEAAPEYQGDALDERFDQIEREAEALQGKQ